MELEYSITGRKIIKEQLDDLSSIINDFIGTQPKPLQFVDAHYYVRDETGFCYNEPVPDDYPVLNYDNSEKDNLLNRIEVDVPIIINKLSEDFKGNLVKNSVEAGQEIYNRFSGLKNRLNNVVIIGSDSIYKNCLISIVEASRQQYAEYDEDTISFATILSSDPIEQKHSVENNLFHRQYALIYKYKADAGYIPNEFKRTEIRKQHGKGREKAFDSVNEYSKTYKPIKARELEAIIPYLADFPNAQKAAINDLDKLN